MQPVTTESYSIVHPWGEGTIRCELVEPKVGVPSDATVLSIGNGYGAGTREMRVLARYLAREMNRPVQTYDDPRVEAALIDPLEYRKQTREVVLRSLGDRSVTLLGWSTGGLVDTWVARDVLDPETSQYGQLDIVAKMTLGMAGIVNFRRPLDLARQGSLEVLRAPLHRIDPHIALVALQNSPRYFGGATKLKLAAREVEQLSRASAIEDIRSIIAAHQFPYKAVTFEYDGIFPAELSTRILREAGIDQAHHTTLRGFTHIDLAWRPEAQQRVAYLLDDLEMQQTGLELGGVVNG